MQEVAQRLLTDLYSASLTMDNMQVCKLIHVIDTEDSITSSATGAAGWLAKIGPVSCLGCSGALLKTKPESALCLLLCNSFRDPSLLLLSVAACAREAACG